MRITFKLSCLLIISLRTLCAQSLTTYVNPFIGTADGGNTFPGAVLPWGMVSVSPHTAPNSPSGYIHNGKYFYGFGHVHLSGTGCADLGSIIISATRGAIETDPETYKCTFTDETASPGYYRAILQEPHLLAEVSATTRAGITRFTSLERGGFNILVDAGRGLGLLGGGSVTIRSDAEAEGYTVAGGFCGEENRQRVYFAMQFSEPSAAHGIWVGHELVNESSRTVQDAAVGCWFRFNAIDTLLVKVGISYVSAENARLNLQTEVPHWDFLRVRAEANSAWEEVLSRIRVEGNSRDLTKFYTALYHMLIHPNVITDANGEYPLMNHSGIGRYRGQDRYTVLSLWDTYRTVHPFLTLVYPEKQLAIIQTMLDMYKESGWLPKWELAGNETHLMVGDPAAIVIADSYINGIRDFDVREAYETIKKPATTPGKESDQIRPGYHDYLKYGYIPFEQDTMQNWWVWGPASTTLEYCLADWSISQMAREMGNEIDHKEFARRSQFYRNIFDSQTKLMRPRLKNGNWLSPFDPLQTEGSGSWRGSGGPGYVEGNAWSYTWFVPHDIEGLMALFGDKESFVAKLQQCFTNEQFTINNEPDIAYPYLFTYVPGEEHRTAALVRKIMEQQFGTGASGLPGNDDCGTISGWFVFSALGFYPTCPASGEYRLGAPLFRKATIRLNNEFYSGREFTIESARASGRITSIRLDGRKLTSYRISHEDIVTGKRLEFISSD